MHRRNFLTNAMLQVAALTAAGSLPATASAQAANSSQTDSGGLSTPEPGVPSGLSFPSRERFSLDGEWEYEPLARTTLQQDGSIQEDRASLPAAGHMQVPSNWHLAGLPNLDGRVAFRRRFTVGSQFVGNPVWLCLGGMDYFAHVRLNGTPLGSHEGYLEPFEFEVSKLLVNGANEIEIVVDAPREDQQTMWPGKKRQIKGIFNLWVPLDRQMETTGGIIGSVCLERRPSAQIRSVRYSSTIVPPIPAVTGSVGTSPSGYAGSKPQAKILVEVEFWLREAGSAGLELKIGPASWRGSVTGQGGANRQIAVLTIDEPQLWWTWDTGEPHLYDASVALTRGTETDRCVFKAGIREIHFDPALGEWRLNGQRFFVRGSSVIPAKWLAHYSETQIAKDIELLRQAHINGVRVCVHVTRDEFYAACDRAGILVWQDFPLQWQYTLENNFIAEACRQLQAMIRRLYNHPCIGLWTCQNEPDPPNRQGMDPTLATAARAADSSRFVFEACEYGQHPYPGWYLGQLRDFEDLPSVPVVSEFGAQGLLSAAEMRQLLGPNAWPPNAKWIDSGFETRSTFVVAGIERGKTLEEFVANSQAYQAQLIQFAIENYRRAKYQKLGGFFHFMFMDGWPTISWSVLSYNRVPKAGYWALQRAMQPILPVVTLMAPRLAARPKEQWSLLAGAWLLNDTREPLKACRIRFELRGPGSKTLLRELVADVPADSVQPLDADLQLPASVHMLVPGAYKLVISANSRSGALLGENLYELAVEDIGDFEAAG